MTSRGRSAGGEPNNFVHLLLHSWQLLMGPSFFFFFLDRDLATCFRAIESINSFTALYRSRCISTSWFKVSVFKILIATRSTLKTKSLLYKNLHLDHPVKPTKIPNFNQPSSHKIQIDTVSPASLSSTHLSLLHP